MNGSAIKLSFSCDMTEQVSVMYRDLKLTGTLILQSEDITKREKQIPPVGGRKKLNCNVIVQQCMV